MRLNGIAIAVVVAFSCFASQGLADDGTVQLPLGEYDKLRAAAGGTPTPTGPSVAVVDKLSVSGAFGATDFGLVIAGRSLGGRSAIPFLKDADVLGIHSCDGNGVVSRDGDFFVVTPLAERFAVKCRLSGASEESLTLTTTPKVMWVETDVSDAEVARAGEEDGAQRCSIAKKLPPKVEPEKTIIAEVLEPTALGRYRLTLRQDRVDFKYHLDFANPNQKDAELAIDFKSGEHASAVESKAKYEPTERGYAFKLPPGDSSIVISGTLPEKRFVPPIRSDAQYVLVEAHPLLQASFQTQAKRVSPQEVGLAPQFRGAQAWLVGSGESLAWTTTVVKALHANSYAVPSSRHEFYVADNGEVLGDSTISIDNQGAAEVTVPMKGTPNAASMDGSPILLTQNAAGDFWTQLKIGTQELAVQSQHVLSKKLGLAWGILWLPQVSAPASTSSISVRYPRQWTPLFESFRGEVKMPLAPQLVGWAAALGLWSAVLAGTLGLSKRRRVIFGIAAFGATVAATSGFWSVVLLNVALTFMWLRPRIGWNNPLGPGAIIAVMSLGMISLIGVVSIFGQDVRSLFGASSAAVSGQTSADPQAYSGKKGLTTSSKSMIDEPADYEGLPAKTIMPTGALQVSFRAEMLRTQTPVGVRVLLIATWLANAIATLLLLISLALIAREHEAIRGAFAVKLREPEPAPLPA